jgi:nucleoside-diphosphate-sugar epimerase
MREQHVVLGTGPLGAATAEALLVRGHAVTLVNRSGKAAVPPGARVIKADLFDVGQVREATTGATAVYQCAQPAYEAWTTQFEPLQSAIIEGVAASGAKLIVAENLYMYGAVQGPIHEELPYAAHTRKGVLRARMAEQVAEAHRRGKLPTAAARGSDFYGPGVLGSTLGERVFLPVLKGKPAQLIGRQDQPHSYTYIGDFGATLVLLGERDEALGRHWHVPTAPARTQRELLDLIGVELETPVRASAMGRLMLGLAGLFIPAARETVEMLYEFERPFVIDGSRFERAFGLQPTPLVEGLRQTIAWYRAQQGQATVVG